MTITNSTSSQSRYKTISNSDRHGLLEYNDIVYNYFTEILHDKGFQPSHSSISVEQHTKEVEAIHLEVQQKLQDDPRAVELMKYFGID